MSALFGGPYAAALVVPPTLAILAVIVAVAALGFASDGGDISAQPISAPGALLATSKSAPDGGTGGGVLLTGASTPANPGPWSLSCSPWIGQRVPEWVQRENLELAA